MQAEQHDRAPAARRTRARVRRFGAGRRRLPCAKLDSGLCPAPAHASSRRTSRARAPPGRSRNSLFVAAAVVAGSVTAACERSRGTIVTSTCGLRTGASVAASCTSTLISTGPATSGVGRREDRDLQSAAPVRSRAPRRRRPSTCRRHCQDQATADRDGDLRMHGISFIQRAAACRAFASVRSRSTRRRRTAAR